MQKMEHLIKLLLNKKHAQKLLKYVSLSFPPLFVNI